MDILEIIQRYKLPSHLEEILRQSGVNELFPPQIQALRRSVLDGKNLVLSVPTAAGKTLIAELCMLKSILKDGGRCLYITPLRAIASEKYEDFKQKYSNLNINIGIATGDYNLPSSFLANYQILISTPEKVDSLLRFRAKWLIENLNVLVLDEIHNLGDETRGPTLEILTARLKQLNPKVQILALSATITNANEIAKWLNAELVTSNWRPVPLKEGVSYKNRIFFANNQIKTLEKDSQDDLTNLTLDTLKDKGQVLIFVNSRRSTQAVSKLLSKEICKVLNTKEKEDLKSLAQNLGISKDEATDIDKKLIEFIKCGVAFHHAGLRYRHRKLIEDNFKTNLLKVICSTPTLAAGVNLPARCVIIRDFKRYEAGLGSAFIPTFEYKQCAGRAGRPKYDKFGEAILLAKTISEMKTLFERYINAYPEPVTSKLDNEATLRFHILSSIASGYVYDIKGMFDFLTHTFLSFQKRTQNLIEIIAKIFEFLENEEMIARQGFRFYATTFGNCISRLYIDPVSGIILRDGLKKAKALQIPTELYFLQLIASCPDMEVLSLNKKDFEKLNLFISYHKNEFLEDELQSKDYLSFMATVKVSWFLLSWIEEEKEKNICDNFGIGPGDIYRHIESAEWLMYAASIIAEVIDLKELTFTLSNLSKRINYGIKEELLELIDLKGVGRIRARNLFKNGFKKISDLRFASVDELSKITQIGNTLALSITQQIHKLSSGSPKKYKFKRHFITQDIL